MIWNKIRNAVRDGTLIEKVLQRDPLFELKRLSKQFYRFRGPAFHQHCRKRIETWFCDRAEVRSLFRKTFGDFSSLAELATGHHKNQIICCADRYLKHYFNLLGSGEIKLEPVDWHTDFKSGFRWNPGTFYLDYVQVDLHNDADVKVPRELSRCHHFLILGQAYLLTGEEKYTQEFICQISDFIKKNPVMFSINWGCTMDVAIRAVNWLWALAIFMTSPLLTEAVLKNILVSLLEHGSFIHKNPEIMHYPENRHNHYVSNLAGQIYLGILFRRLPEASRWLQDGIRCFYREMRTQILPNGPTYERSTNYHRLVLELFLSTIVLLDRCGFEVPPDIWCRLEKMFEFVLHYTKPDGMAPIIGDQDDGRFHPFSLQKNIDHRYLLAVGAIIFDRPDFKKYSDGYNADCFFLLGKRSGNQFADIPYTKMKLQSERFSDAGFYIMRNEKNYMFINISGKGRYSELPAGTHTHSDLLSFELVVDGRTFLVDPGTYIYSADPKARQLFRATRMHNTVVVDHENQNIIREENLWNFERNAIPRLNTWASCPEKDFFSAEHTGYMRLPQPVLHRRDILFNKTKIQWEITDYLSGSGCHMFEWYFHFDAGIDLDLEENRILTDYKGDVAISLAFSSELPLDLTIENGWISKAYGKREHARVVKVSTRGNCPAELVTRIQKVGRLR